MRGTRTQNAAKAIRAAGFEVLSTGEPDDSSDGEIIISERLNVQVGDNYYCVTEETIDEEFIFIDCGNSLPKVIAALRENVEQFNKTLAETAQ